MRFPRRRAAAAAALDDAVALCESLGHHITGAQLPPITPEVGAAIGTGFNAAPTPA